jgi:hypothetical protein
MTARLTDDLLRVALRPAPDVAAPDHFMASLLSGMATHAQRREPRLKVLGRSAFGSGRVVLIVLLLLALLIGAVWIASQRTRLSTSGPVMLVNAAGVLTSVDPDSGTLLATFPGEGRALGVGRSTDGLAVAYWTIEGSAAHLWLARSDGAGAREIPIDAAISLAHDPGGVIFSMDGGAFVATATADEVERVLVVRVDDGTASLIGPPGIGGYVPSPDGTEVAFNYGNDFAQHDTIGVMNVDGTQAHPITDNRLFSTHGPDSWSRDGWIYFGADSHSDPVPTYLGYLNGIFRVNVPDQVPQRLTPLDVVADAASLSPDENSLAYTVWTNPDRRDLWVMSPVGVDQHLLSASANFLGWSADSQSILAELHHTNGSGDLAIIPLDGTGPTKLISMQSCSGCFSDVSWGFPRP